MQTNKYLREIKPNVWVDVYDVLLAFKVADPMLQHIIKKALAAGQRGHKDFEQDIKDIKDSAERAYNIHCVKGQTVTREEADKREQKDTTLDDFLRHQDKVPCPIYNPRRDLPPWNPMQGTWCLEK